LQDDLFQNQAPFPARNRFVELFFHGSFIHAMAKRSTVGEDQFLDVLPRRRGAARRGRPFVFYSLPLPAAIVFAVGFFPPLIVFASPFGVDFFAGFLALAVAFLGVLIADSLHGLTAVAVARRPFWKRRKKDQPARTGRLRAATRTAPR